MVLPFIQQYSTVFTQCTTWEECKQVLQSIEMESSDTILESLLLLYFYSIHTSTLPLSFLQRIQPICITLLEYDHWKSESEFVYFVNLASIHFLEKAQWFPLLQCIVKKSIQQCEDLEESIYYSLILQQSLEFLPLPLQWCMNHFSFPKHQLLLTIEYEACSKLSSGIFDVIKVYPLNEKSLTILKIGMSHLKSLLQPKLFTSLHSSLEKRLLFAGASTSAILDQFVNMIHSLHRIDYNMVQFSFPPFVQLFDSFCNYLQKNRKDFYTCFMHRTLQHQDDFFSLLTNKKEEEEHALDSMDYLIQLATNPETNSRDELLHAYQYQMALQCLLVPHEDSQSWNQITLAHEWMKIRLGYKAVLSVEIMLKDVNDSKRLNHRFSQQQQDHKMQSLILSQNYWPSSWKTLFENNPYFAEEERYEIDSKNNMYQLHPLICEQIKTFEMYFDKIKAPRYLLWIPCLSVIELEVECSNGTIMEVALHPLEASIVLYFMEQSKWTISQLCEQLQFVDDPSILIQKCNALHSILEPIEEEVYQLK